MDTRFDELAEMIRNGDTRPWSIKFERNCMVNVLWAWVTNQNGKQQGYSAGEMVKVWSRLHNKYGWRIDGTQGFMSNYFSKKEAWQALEDDFIDQIKQKVEEYN